MITDNKDACMVQWNEEDKKLLLFIELNHEGLSFLNNIAEMLDIEDSIVMSLHTNDIMVDAFNFIKGYGISIEELWKERPKNLR